MQVLKFFFPKESTIESLTVDTLIQENRRKNNKISGNYYLIIRVYIANDSKQAVHLFWISDLVLLSPTNCVPIYFDVCHHPGTLLVIFIYLVYFLRFCIFMCETCSLFLVYVLYVAYTMYFIC